MIRPFNKKSLRSPELSSENEGPMVLWLLLGLVTIGFFTAGAPWILRSGILFIGSGLLMIGFRKTVALPMPVVVLTGLVLFGGLTCFLPAQWFGIPGWRKGLSDLGVNTGNLVAIQWRQAMEQYLMFALVLLTGLWITCLRSSSSQLRNVAMAFIWIVAAYGLLSFLLRNHLPVRINRDHFGFFPNRNHSATLLSMGAVCGAGVALQALRHKHFWRLGFALTAVAISLYAAFVWSISRSGIVLSATGLCLWALLLGPRYFRRREQMGAALFALLMLGVYSIAESRVKTRISQTAEKISAVSGSPLQEASDSGEFNDVDYRIPIARDTFRMIESAPLTGVGAGQYRYVFPQFRVDFAHQTENEALHPESSWLWWAAEMGLPAALALGCIALFLFVLAYRNIKRPSGKERALRMGCLMAAAIIPIHCFFDVPAHRTPLLWASAFLYAASFRASEAGYGRPPGRIPSLVLGLALLGVGLRLLGTEWWNVKLPYTMVGQEALVIGAESFGSFSSLQQSDRFKALEARHQAANLAKKAYGISPLEHKLYHLEAVSLLPVDREAHQVTRSFEIERKLLPFSIKIPLLQASALIPYHKEKTIAIWSELLKSPEFSTRKPEARNKIIRMLELEAAGNPEIYALWKEESPLYLLRH